MNFRKFGINTTFVDPDDPENFRKAITPKTKLLYAETLGNPLINVLDIEAVAAIANEAGVPLVIDNTFAIALPVPADQVRRRHRGAFGHQVHRRPRHHHGRRDRRVGQVSLGQRQVSGHDRALARLSRRDFPRDFRRFRLHHEVRAWRRMRTFGPALSPFNAWMLLQGLETLHVRMERHVPNAVAVAKFLAGASACLLGELPGPAGQQVPRARAEIPAEGRKRLIMTFGIKGGMERRREVHRGAAVLEPPGQRRRRQELVIHPASTTHRQLSEEEQIKAGVRPDMIRLSIGIEDIDDILWDIDQALAKSQV